MANTALQLTGQSTPSGRIPFLRYDPPNETKPQPLIIFLHGQGEGSNVHNTTSVLTLQESGHGIFTLTKSANLPTFTSPLSGEQFQYYMLGPQLYYPAGVTSGVLWPTPNVYISQMITYALNPSNGMNVNPNMIYLTGLSLGAGGTLVSLMENNINKWISAFAITCPGYGNASAFFTPDTGIANNLARSGVRCTHWFHTRGDTQTNPSGGELISSQIVRNINKLKPLCPVNYVEFTAGDDASGHNIWYRLYNTTPGTNYPTSNGQGYTYNETMFVSFLRHIRRNQNAPYYI